MIETYYSFRFVPMNRDGSFHQLYIISQPVYQRGHAYGTSSRKPEW